MNVKKPMRKLKVNINVLRSLRKNKKESKGLGLLIDKRYAPRIMRRGKEAELTGRIVVPGNSEYNSARREFNTYFNKFPRVIVFAQKTQDAINALRWARYNNVPIRMRSGRHSYEGLSVVDGGIVIDVSDMHEVDVNRKRGVATVRQLLQPLLRSGSPRKVVIKEIPWIESVGLVAKTTPTTPFPFKSVGPYVYHRLPEDAIATIRRYIESPPTSGVSIFLHGLGGAVAKVPNRATAYYYRRALYNMTPTATWNTQAESRRGIRWVENFRSAMLPYTRGVYVNTPDLQIENWQQAYYGSNFARLTRVKAHYDPKNIFHFPQSIPPARR